MNAEERKSKVLEAFRNPDSYDYFMGAVNPFDRIYTKIMWGFSDYSFSKDLLNELADSTDAKILDVPCGTGLFTVEKYSQLKEAEITGVDYSPQMLEKAKIVYEDANIQNVQLLRADVANLPFEKESFDYIICLNGIHSFPQKQEAFQEIMRVLRQNGMLLGCTYIKDENKRSDKLVLQNFVPRGLFTPPFYTKSELMEILLTACSKVKVWNHHAIACFKCIK